LFDKNKVDTRVMVQLSPSLVDHKKIQLDKIDGSDLFKLKVETYTTTHIQSYHQSMLHP